MREATRVDAQSFKNKVFCNSVVSDHSNVLWSQVYEYDYVIMYRWLGAFAPFLMCIIPCFI